MLPSLLNPGDVCSLFDSKILQESIALLLKPLVYLRTLHLHLDIPVAGLSLDAWYESLDKYQKVQDRAADTIAPHLGSCVELLKLGRLGYSWAVYRVLRGDANVDGGRTAPVCVQYDSVLSVRRISLGGVLLLTFFCAWLARHRGILCSLRSP